MKVLRRVLIGVAAFLAVVVVALQIALNSSYVRGIIADAASQACEGTIRWSGMKFTTLQSFPRLRVKVDSLSITYPHDLFSQWDDAPVKSRTLSAGRGESVDTLASFSHFSAAVNIWRIFGGRIRLHHATVSGLRVFAHCYDSTAANWDIFGSSSDEPEDTTSAGLPSLPWISIGKIALEDRPSVVYTAQADTIFAGVRFQNLSVAGNLKLGKLVKLRRFHLGIDSLRVFGRLPADTLAFSLDRLALDENSSDVFDLGVDARAMLFTNAFGRMRVPVNIDSKVGVRQKKNSTDVDLEYLHANLAHVPVEAYGKARLLADSTFLSGTFLIDNCSVEKILREYLDGIVEDTRDIKTDALLTASVAFNGYLSDVSIPEVNACIQLPKCQLSYKPLDLSGTLSLDLDAAATPQQYVTAQLGEFSVHIPGLDLDAGASVNDALGADPAFSVKTVLAANLARLVRYLPEDMHLKADGSLDLNLSAASTLKDIQAYKGKVDGRIVCDTLAVSQGDALFMSLKDFNLTVHNSTTDIGTDSQFHPFYGTLNVAGLRMRDSDSLFVGVRGMKNTVRISRAEEDGRVVPRLSIEDKTDGMFVGTGADRIALRSLEVGAAVTKRVRGSSYARRRHVRDSLRRAHPGQMPDFLSEKDFEKGDIDISLDESLSRYLKEWKPSANISIGGARIMTPSLPLRIRVTGLDGVLDDDVLSLNKLGVTAGTSDISAHGSLKGIRRSLQRKGLLDLSLDVESQRINANELLLALEAGSKNTTAASSSGISSSDDDAYENSYAVDTLANASIQTDSMSLIIVPANIKAELNLNVNRVDYSDLDISKVKAKAVMKGRCIQVTDATVITDAGVIEADAFYSTKTKEDISAGFNLNVKDASADKIIRLVPTVDDLMPAIKSFKGNLNMELAATTQLDTNMNVVIPTLDGIIRITGQDLQIDDAGDLRSITKLLMFRNKNIGHIQDLYVNGVIHNSRLEIFPFILGIDRYKLALSGYQKFDTSFKYNISLLKTPLPFRIGVNVKGNFDHPRFSLGRARYRNGKVPSFTEQIDTMKVNIVDCIRNVYSQGVDAAIRKAAESRAVVETRKTTLGYDTEADLEPLSDSEYNQMDSLSFVQETEPDIIATEQDAHKTVVKSIDNTETLVKEYIKDTAVEAGSGKKKRQK